MLPDNRLLNLRNTAISGLLPNLAPLTNLQYVMAGLARVAVCCQRVCLCAFVTAASAA